MGEMLFARTFGGASTWLAAFTALAMSCFLAHDLFTNNTDVLTNTKQTQKIIAGASTIEVTGSITLPNGATALDYYMESDATTTLTGPFTTDPTGVTLKCNRVGRQVTAFLGGFDGGLALPANSGNPITTLTPLPAACRPAVMTSFAYVYPVNTTTVAVAATVNTTGHFTIPASNAVGQYPFVSNAVSVTFNA